LHLADVPLLLFYKIMPTGLRGFQKGHIGFNKGSHWKIKDTSKMGHTSWIKGKHIKINNALEEWRKNGGTNKGKHWKLSEKTKNKIREYQKRIVKEGKHHLWKGGISYEPYSIDWTDTLKKSIRQRDKYTCQICGKEPAIIIHHIDYNKENCNPNNLITLCRKCHAKTNQNRNYWLNYFKNYGK